MQMNDTRLIAADPALVWQALLNPEVLKACVPGCEEMTGTAADGFEAVVVQKVGPVKARLRRQFRALKAVHLGEQHGQVGGETGHQVNSADGIIGKNTPEERRPNQSVPSTFSCTQRSIMR
jgi:carbon monoxide dehydrogenase subunit G